MLQTSPDHERLRRFAAGEVSAFEEIVQAHQGRVTTLCRYMLGDATEAEDAAQDVFVKAFKALATFRPEAAVSTWLYRVAVNTCIDRRRKPFLRWLARSDEGEAAAATVPSEAPSPEDQIQSRQTSDRVQAALARLPPKLRAAIVLKEIEGLAYDQIAETLEISIGTVKSRIFRAREALKVQLAPETGNKRGPSSVQRAGERDAMHEGT